MHTEVPLKAAMKLCVLLGLVLFNGLTSLAFASEPERTEIIETARKYLIHGLLDQKPDLIPLSQDCWRVEQGKNTGSSGQEIKQRLLGDEYKVITGISNERWLVEGDEAVVFYDLHVSGLDGPVLIAERFRVVNRQIEEIEAIFYRYTPPPTD